MAQRFESKDSLDDFPTPPWATRAFLNLDIKHSNWRDLTCWEPACGRGYMSTPLSEQFKRVISSDVHDYGYGEIHDFLSSSSKSFFNKPIDWVITNPPFKKAEEFVLKGLEIANCGVAVLCRTVFLESIGRYNRLFSKIHPTAVAQYVERVPMVRGRVDKNASTATGYAWIIWEKNSEINNTRLLWIPPSRKKLEKMKDYNQDFWFHFSNVYIG